MIGVQEVVVSVVHEAAQLQARPRAESPGVSSRTGDLKLAGVTVHVPASYRAAHPAGLLVMFHGAGGTPEHAMELVERVAADHNLIIVAPKSEKSTWDVLDGGLGPDVARADAVLAAVFSAYVIDASRVAVGGFSDGASYALTLGLANGELFRSVLAFSPGCELAPRRRGQPRIFVSHGTEDRVLPIAPTSRRLVSKLSRAGYDVDYYEFSGGHSVPIEAVRKAMTML